MDRKWWTLIVVCVGIFMLLLDITIVNVALPDIAATFGASLSGLQWVIDAYALGLASLLLTGGTLADRYGRRLLFAIGTGVFTTGSALCGTASGIYFLALSRGFQGIGGAVMFATSLALLSDSFRGKERGLAFGAWGATTGLAIAIGPLIGGALVTGLGWRWIFFVNIPVSAVAFALTLLRVNESKDPARKRLDLLGFFTFSTGLGALIFALIRSANKGWSSPAIIGSLAAAALLLGGFVVAERVRRDPMFDLRLLRVPTFDGGLVAAFGISASIFSVFTYLVIWVQNGLGFSALATGIRFLPMSATIFVTAAIAGRLTSFIPARLLIGPGFLLMGVSLLLMCGLTADSNWTHLLAGLVLSGVAGGMVNVPLVATAVGVVEPQRAGMASGINSTFRQIGIATGIAVLGTIFISRLRTTVMAHLAGTPLAAHSREIADAAGGGQMQVALQQVPPELRGLVLDASRAGYADGLNLILLISALLVFLTAVLSFFLIREKDFVAGQGASGR